MNTCIVKNHRGRTPEDLPRVGVLPCMEKDGVVICIMMVACSTPPVLADAPQLRATVKSSWHYIEFVLKKRTVITVITHGMQIQYSRLTRRPDSQNKTSENKRDCYHSLRNAHGVTICWWPLLLSELRLPKLRNRDRSSEDLRRGTPFCLASW